jgi:hypothetical protein
VRLIVAEPIVERLIVAESTVERLIVAGCIVEQLMVPPQSEQPQWEQPQ